MDQVTDAIKTGQDAFSAFADSAGPQGLIAIGAAMLVIVVIALIASARSRSAAMSHKLHEMEANMADQLKKISEQTESAAKESRDDAHKSILGVNEAVTKAMGEMTRTQQSQLDAFAGQLRDVNVKGEERLAGIQTTVEQRLVQYQDRMDRVNDVLDEKLGKNDEQLEKLRSVFETRMESMQRDNGQRLLQIEQTVDTRLNTTLDKRLNESFQLVNDRLEAVYQGLGEMQTIASGMGDLKRVLSNVHAKGVVGKIQLSALLSQMMTPEQYKENVRIRPGGENCSACVVLPGKTAQDKDALLPIDATFPETLYEQLVSAINDSDQQRVSNLEAQLATAVREGAERVRSHFLYPPETTEFAVLFLGSEGLYAEVIRVPGLQQQIQRDYNVMLAGPSTLSALLNSLQMGMKTIAIERRSEEVWALLGAVRGEIGTFAEALTRTQKRIRQASESIEDAAQKSRIIQRKLRGVEPLEGSARKSLLKADDLDDDDYEGGDWD